MKNIIPFLLIFTHQFSFAQLAPDFTVTDTDNQVHKLYDDYLNQGKVVVLKVFFVNCPPCNAIATAVQQKYVDWGSGNGNVQFIEMTNKIGDTNPYVIGYKNMHGLTFPSISADGGALNAIIPYTNGTFGLWSGTPLFAVIAPNKTVHYDVLFSNLSAVIELAGGSMAAPPTSVNLNVAFAGPSLPAGVSYWLKSATVAGPTYNITQLTNGTHQFSYPSATFPELQNPIIEIVSTANAGSTLLTVTDLVNIRNHILGSQRFTNESQKIASDVNSSGTISVTDLVLIQKVIAGLLTQFPNNTPSYKLIPASIPLIVPQGGGGTVTVQGELIKMGNVK
ncbi:MAG: dockerin type I repeat-containing protein [Saprospiraceae bacterium]|nr:dockerin type I repeat-containing protein [Saprospiraceae bacterium]